MAKEFHADPTVPLAEVVNALSPGDTLVLREGVYRETLIPARSGTADMPVTICAAANENVVFSGCDPLSDPQKEGEGLWSVETDIADLWTAQVFIDGRRLWLARWPTAPQGAFLEFPTASMAKGSKRGLIVDACLPPGDLSGARVWASSHKRWYSWTARVQRHSANQLWIEDTTDDAGKHTPAEGGVYAILGSEALFDSPWEWWHDGKRLWFRLPPDYSGAQVLEVQRREVAVDLRGRQHVHLRGLRTRAGTILTDAESAYCVLDRLCCEHVSHSWIAEDQYQSQKDDTGIVLAGTGHRLSNSEVAFSSGNGVVIQGTDVTIVNCHIHDVNYAGTCASGVELGPRSNPLTKGLLPSRNAVVSHCTLERSGRSLIGTGRMYDSLIQFCELRYAGMLTWDLGMTYGNGINGGGSEIRYNHMHHNLTGSHNMGLYHDHGCKNILNHHNVVWGTDYAALKNNQYAMYLFWYHNTAVCDEGGKGQAYGSTWAAAQPRQLWGCELRGNYLQGAIDIRANAGEMLVADNVRAGHIPLDAEGIPAASTQHVEHPIAGLVGPVQSTRCGARDPDVHWQVGHDFGREPDVDTRRSRVVNRNRLVDACFEGGEWGAWDCIEGAEIRHVDGANSQWVIDAEARMGYYAVRLPRRGARVSQTVTGLEAGQRWTAIAHCDVRSGSRATVSLTDANGTELTAAHCLPRKTLHEKDHGFQAVVVSTVVPETSVTLAVTHTGTDGVVHADDLGLARTDLAPGLGR